MSCLLIWLSFLYPILLLTRHLKPTKSQYLGNLLLLPLLVKCHHPSSSASNTGRCVASLSAEDAKLHLTSLPHTRTSLEEYPVPSDLPSLSFLSCFALHSLVDHARLKLVINMSHWTNRTCKWEGVRNLCGTRTDEGPLQGCSSLWQQDPANYAGSSTKADI